MSSESRDPYAVIGNILIVATVGIAAWALKKISNNHPRDPSFDPGDYDLPDQRMLDNEDLVNTQLSGMER
jgi:hypothetical protein